MSETNENFFIVQKNGDIHLNYKKYGISWRGDVHDLRLILDHTPLKLERIHNSRFYKYSINNKDIWFEFDELLYENEKVSLRWIRRNSSKYVLMKRLKHVNSSSLFQEAIIHTIVFHCLEYFNLTKVVPRVYDIVKYDSETVFTMEAFPLSITFSDYLVQNFAKLNTHCFIEVFAQIALYMLPLQRILFFNHRDLKSDNILIEQTPVKHEILFKGKKYIVHASIRAILIDFGFGCIGVEHSGTPILNSGSVLPAIDPCPKDGRDIFHILTSLYSFNLFRENLNPGLKILFDKWLTVGEKSYKDGVIRNENDPEWIYSVTSGSFFSAPGCSPSAILDDIATHYPQIVKVEDSGPVTPSTPSSS